MFWPTAIAKSPRIEPVVASSGFVAPITWRAARMAASPSSTSATIGPDLDQRAAQRDLLEALAHPADEQQLGAHHRIGDRERGARVVDQEREGVRGAADERRGTGDEAAGGGGAAPGHRSVVGEPLG